MNYDFLYQHISVGVENAIHQQDLAARLNTTPAAAKNIVRQARQQGLQILSGVNGYWFAADENEKQAFCKLRYRPDGFAEQNGRGAERADTLTL